MKAMSRGLVWGAFACLMTVLFSWRDAAAGVVGWRGDGTGRYPDAVPPTEWCHVAKAVRELSAQARKPKGADRGKPIADGVVRDWLVLGPVPIPEGRSWNFAWSWRANTPWWWADGKRDVYEIARRSALEIGREFNEAYLEDVLAQFEFFTKCGYASLEQRD